MRILHIITRMIIGGAQENTLYNCLDLMRDYGDEVLLLTGPTAGPEGELLQGGRAGDLRVQEIPALQRAIAPLTDRQAYTQLRKAIRAFGPDVVHTHSAKAGFLGRLAATREGVPAVVHTVHGAPFHPYQPFLARRVFITCEWWAARHCHRLISVADAMTDLLVDAGVAPREKFQTIYSGMEVEPFLQAEQHRAAARHQLGFSDEHVVIGKIARLFHLKGHDDLLLAARDVIRQQPQVHFLLVGDGILRPQLEQQATDLGIRNHIHFAGLVSPDSIPYYLSAMDLLVHTSLREGLARTLPQALLRGIPVVSYDIDGAREVCLEAETGALIPPRDIPRLTAALLQLSQDAELRKRYGEAGRKLCETRFDHRVMTQQIRDLYEAVLASPR